MDSLERVRIILGISSNNEEKLQLLSVYMEKAREDIEAVCRDNFLDPDTGEDIFPKQLNSVLEDLVLARYRKRQAEGYNSQTLGDESTSFQEYFPDSIKQRLYPFTRLIPRR